MRRGRRTEPERTRVGNAESTGEPSSGNSRHPLPLMHEQDLPLLALHTLHRPLRHRRRFQKRGGLEPDGKIRRDAQISRAVLLRRREAARRLRHVLEPCESVPGADGQAGNSSWRSPTPATRGGGSGSDRPLRARLERHVRRLGPGSGRQERARDVVFFDWELFPVA